MKPIQFFSEGDSSGHPDARRASMGVAYDEGLLAGIAMGQDENDCPYPNGDLQRYDWIEGTKDAKRLLKELCLPDL